MTTPLDLVASMVLEDGSRWGESAVPEQWDDMEALLSPDGRRKHFWLRARGRSKPLALDTPLPTPSGWTTMGEVGPGDRLLDENGVPCTVTGVKPVLLGEGCWRVTFDDRSSIVASSDHEWAVENHRSRGRRSKHGIPSPHGLPGGVAGLPLMTTREMAERVRYGPRNDLSLSAPCARAWDLPETDLPLPPYILGYWFGDGHAHTAMVTIGAEDIGETSAQFEALGFPLHSPQYKPGADCASWRFGTGEGVTRAFSGPPQYDTSRILGELGVRRNKHIPMTYLRASAKQRLELLRGLMDTDGHVACGRAVFNNTCEALADGVMELVASFGWKARRGSFRAKLNGKDCGICYKVSFRPDVSPFHLTRKTGRMQFEGQRQRSRHTSRMITAIERVPSVPVRCITVDSPSHLYLAGRAGVPTHNSFDTGAATLATMLSGEVHAGDEMYAAAAGREQAGILARKIRQIAECTPDLATAVEVQNFRVVTPRTGAILDVISSDLATSWGKTPRWLFVDEICNHDGTEGAKGFVDALLTALPKRRDSVALMASTPSSPNHWSRELWDFAMTDALWRCSRSDGPAPWQDPEELESERRRLPVALWRRLYLCEWAELDDALATLEQVRACIGHEGILGPDPEYAYVHGADLSYARDTTAVATCHVEIRGGREVLVVDRIRAWRPGKGGRQIPLAEVQEYGSARAREYGGMINADPYQGVVIIQKWREAGHQVKAATFNPLSNSRRASLLLSLIRERQIDLPADETELFNEITSLRLAEGSTPGVLKLTTDGSSEGHFDRVMAVMLCAEELMSRPAGSWLDAYAAVVCDECHQAYTDGDECPRCYPHAHRTAGRDVPADAEPVGAGGWMAAYGAKICSAGHAYVPRKGRDGCPRCGQGGGQSRIASGFPRAGGMR